jgi:hypothetical protein
MSSSIKRTQINTFPPKSFFVKTLVRDIDLLDSILDLIDNSIDSYIKKGFSKRKLISVKLLKDSFIIEDNCGGIEKESVYEHVFRFGDMSETKRKKPLESTVLVSSGPFLRWAVIY